MIRVRDSAMRVREALLGNSAFDEMKVLGNVLPKSGTMIDVGAHHGSALVRFAEAGWRVHAFEPDRANRAVLERRVGSLPGVTIDARAASDEDGAVVEYYSSAVSSGISGLLRFHESHECRDQVQTVTLATYCRDRNVERVDLLKTDCEGWDLFVLRGFDWKLAPLAVICEFEDRKTRKVGYSYRDLGALLLNEGYELLVSEWYPVIEYGQEHRWRRAFRWSEAEPHREAWGNIVALKGEELVDQAMAAVASEAKGASQRYFMRKAMRAVVRAAPFRGGRSRLSE